MHYESQARVFPGKLVHCKSQTLVFPENLVQSLCKLCAHCSTEKPQNQPSAALRHAPTPVLVPNQTQGKTAQTETSIFEVMGDLQGRNGTLQQAPRHQ